MKAIISTIIFLFFNTNLSPLMAQNCPRTRACDGYQKTKCEQYMSRKHCRYACANRLVWLDKDVIRISDDKTSDIHYFRKTVCPATGTVSYQEMEFDHHRASFMVVQPDRSRSDGQSCYLQCPQDKKNLARTQRT